MFEGFGAIFDENSKVLILGSFPSVKSRENDFYYGNVNNRFWRMLEHVFKQKISNSIEDKTNFLLNKGIALWDIVSKADIIGSLDNDLKALEIAEIDKIVSLGNIKKILCNGKLAYDLTTKHYPQYKSITYRLPSTSPANTRFDIVRWQELLSELVI